MSRSWCRVDPIVHIDDLLYAVTGYAEVEADDGLATARFDIYVKEGWHREVIFDDPGNIAVDYQGVQFHTTSQNKVQFRFSGTPQAGDEGCPTKMVTNQEGPSPTRVTLGTIDAPLIVDYPL